MLSNACSKCECLAPGVSVTSQVKTACPSNLSVLMNDNFCHDEANVPECYYDGGDCCGYIDLTFCSNCTCVDPKDQDLQRSRLY